VLHKSPDGNNIRASLYLVFHNNNNKVGNNMGCWNGTCAMSKLPIFEDDRVVCWFIVSSQGYSRRGYATNFCNPYDLFRLMPLPFRAKYNDYGGIEDIDPDDQQLFDLQLATIGNQLVEFDIGENTSHDIAVKKRDLDFELAMQAMQEGRLQVTGHGEPKHVGLMMILESVFNNLVSNHSWKDYKYPNGYNAPSVVTVIKHDLIGIAKKIKQCVADDLNQKFSFWNASERYIGEYYGIRTILSGLNDEKMPLDHSLFNKVFHALAESNVLDSFANELRMHYGPVSGAGSQEGDLKPYESLIKAMQFAMKERKETMDE
jgi:hypothetical protein